MTKGCAHLSEQWERQNRWARAQNAMPTTRVVERVAGQPARERRRRPGPRGETDAVAWFWAQVTQCALCEAMRVYPRPGRQDTVEHFFSTFVSLW